MAISVLHQKHTILTHSSKSACLSERRRCSMQFVFVCSFPYVCIVCVFCVFTCCSAAVNGYAAINFFRASLSYFGRIGCEEGNIQKNQNSHRLLVMVSRYAN